MKIIPVIFLFIITLSSCNGGVSESQNDVTDNKQSMAGIPNKDTVLSDLTIQILTAIKNKDFTTFSTFIHPELGLLISPYAHVNITKDIKLSAAEFLDQVKKQSTLVWGSYDGSGEAIKMNIPDYFEKFVYNADFLHAEKRSINKMIGIGNTQNNLESVYKGCEYTESYFSGFDKKLEGTDWCSLRLVFKNLYNKYYLVGIVHDQWTI